MTSYTKLPEYSKALFVNREQYLSLVLDKAKKLKIGEGVDRRTTIFLGERGTGKSWLLRALLEQLSVLVGKTVFFLDLGEYTNYDPQLAVANILKRVNDTLSKTQVLLGANLAEMSRICIENIRSHLQTHPFAILIDHVYESNWKLLAELEDYVIGPLAVEPQGLIIMAGRGRPYPFKTPELRLRADFLELDPFTETNTQEQLKRQHHIDALKASEVFQLSRGNPLASCLLAQSSDPAKALDQVIEGMLDPIPSEYRQQTREYLEALCVLRVFDEERIPAMLAVYYNDDRYREWSYAQARSVRETLTRWAFAQWDTEQGGYVLDTQVRQLLETYLIKEKDKKECWLRLQTAASGLYLKWAQDFPRSENRWYSEKTYHDDRLQMQNANCVSVPTY